MAKTSGVGPLIKVNARGRLATELNATPGVKRHPDAKRFKKVVNRHIEVPEYCSVHQHYRQRGASLLQSLPTIETLIDRPTRFPNPDEIKPRPDGPRPQIEGASRRCGAWIKYRGQWCGGPALTGSVYCFRHDTAHNHQTKKRYGSRGGTPMAGFYTNRLSRTLKEAITEHLQLPKDQQFNFREELALYRHSGQELVALYSAVVEKGDSEQITEAGALMRDYIKEVVAVGKEVAAIEATGKDTISIHDVDAFLRQIISEMFAVLGNDPDKIEIGRKIERRIHDNIVMPGRQLAAQNAGPSKTSDEAFNEMLGSVPQQPSEAE